jgi:hypothetical protein
MTVRRSRAAASSANLLATCDRGRPLWRLFDATGALAAETTFAFPGEAPAMADWCARLRPDRLEVISATAYQDLGLDRLAAPIDLHVADPGALAHRTGRQRDHEAACWHRLAAAADRIVAADAAAHVFAAAAWPAQAGKLAHAPAPTLPPAVSHRPGTPRLGIILVDETATCRRLLRAIAAGLLRPPDEAPAAIVLGATADDLGLMRSGGLMISGVPRPDPLLAAPGAVERVEGHTLSGWIGAPAGGAALVRALTAGEEVSATVARTWSSRQIGGQTRPVLAYTLQLPAVLADGDRHTVVVATASGLPLAGSPLIFKHRPGES